MFVSYKMRVPRQSRRGTSNSCFSRAALLALLGRRVKWKIISRRFFYARDTRTGVSRVRQVVLVAELGLRTIRTYRKLVYFKR